jgi:hypothetical protein
VFHGAIVLCLGLLAGLPFGAAAGRSAASAAAHAWRVAHVGDVAIGIMLIAIGGVMPRLALRHAPAALMTWSLVVAAYTFAGATLAAAALGARGTMTGGAVDGAIAVAYGIGITASLLAALLLVVGAGAALRRPGRRAQ